MIAREVRGDGVCGGRREAKNDQHARRLSLTNFMLKNWEMQDMASP